MGRTRPIDDSVMEVVREFDSLSVSTDALECLEGLILEASGGIATQRKRLSTICNVRLESGNEFLWSELARLI